MTNKIITVSEDAEVIPKSYLFPFIFDVENYFFFLAYNCIIFSNGFVITLIPLKITNEVSLTLLMGLVSESSVQREVMLLSRVTK